MEGGNLSSEGFWHCPLQQTHKVNTANTTTAGKKLTLWSVPGNAGKIKSSIS